MSNTRKGRRQPTSRLTDAAWIRAHFEQLVDTYAGQYAVVAEGELFVGYDPVPLEAKARKKHPHAIPHILPIPRPEDFTCAL